MTEDSYGAYCGLRNNVKSNDLSLYLFLHMVAWDSPWVHTFAFICSHRFSALPLDDGQAGFVTVLAVEKLAAQ